MELQISFKHRGFPDSKETIHGQPTIKHLISKWHVVCRCAIKIEYSTNRRSHDALAGRDNPARAGFGRLSGKLRRMIDGRTDVAPPITCLWAPRTLRVKVCMRKWCLNHCYVFGFHRVISGYKKDIFHRVLFALHFILSCGSLRHYEINLGDV